MSARSSRFSVSIGRDSDGPKSTGDINILGLSLSLYQIWLYLAVYNTSSLFGSFVPINPYLTASNTGALQIWNFSPLLAITFMAASAICLLITAAYHSKAKSILTRRRGSIIFGIVCIVGTLLILLTNVAGELMLVFSGLVMAIGASFFLLKWGTIFSRFRFVTAVINAALSFAIALICSVILVNFTPAPVCGIIAICLPLAFMATLTNRNETKLDAPSDKLPASALSSYYIRLALCLAAYGIVNGLMGVLCISEMAPTNEISIDLTIGAGCVTSVMIIIVVLSLSKKETRWDWLYRAIVPIVAIGCACTPLFISDGIFIGVFFFSLAFICLEVLLWVLISSLASDIDSILIFGLGYGVINLFSIVGIISISGVVYFSGLPFEAIDATFSLNATYIIAIVMCVLVILGYSILPRYYELKRIMSAVLNSYITLSDDLSKQASSAIINTDSSAKTAATLETNKDESVHNSEKSSIVQDKPKNDDLSHAETIQTTPATTMATGTPDATSISDLAKEESTSIKLGLEQMGEQTDNSIAPQTESLETHTETLIDSSQEIKRDERGSFMRRCDEISRNYSLSKREQEVFVLLAKGHNAAFITDKLCISRSTAKTHINHIYRKLDIHTQQELLNMVEDRRRGAVGASVDRDKLRDAVRHANEEQPIESNPQRFKQQVEKDLLSTH